MKRFNPAALRAAREKAGLSKPQLTERAGLALDTVYALERETLRSPRDSVVEKLAEALAVEWLDFYAADDRESESKAAS